MFSNVLFAEPTKGLAINFRIPKDLDDPKKVYNEFSLDAENNNHRILRQKFAPAFLSEFPAELLMYEGETKGKENKAPYFLYIGEGDAAEVKGKFHYEEWRDRITRGRMTPGKWEDVDVQTPKGEKLKGWKRITAKGKHAWDMTTMKTNITSYPSVDTFFQMWVYETPQTIAILGWWSTEEARTSSDIEKLAMVTAGTAVVSQVASAPSAPARAK